MRRLVWAFTFTFALISAAGCSGNMQGGQFSTISNAPSRSQAVIGAVAMRPAPAATGFPAPPTGPRPAGWLSRRAKNFTYTGPLLYVSLEYASQVLIYPESGYLSCPIGMITSGVSDPYGLYVDKSANLYVVNQSGSVTLYPPGSVSPTTTYSQDLGRPLYAIVDHNGDVFAGNGNGGSNGGVIVEYQAGGTTASDLLQTPGTEVDGMDFDQSGNLYAAYRGGNGIGSVEKFAPGSTQGTMLGMSLNQPQGLLVDRYGNIIVARTSSDTDDVAVYHHGAVNPSLALRLPSGGVPTQIALTADQKTLFVTSYPNGYIYHTAYPLTTSSQWKLSDQTPQADNQGIALSNGQAF